MMLQDAAERGPHCCDHLGCVGLRVGLHLTNQQSAACLDDHTAARLDHYGRWRRRRDRSERKLHHSRNLLYCCHHESECRRESRRVHGGERCRCRCRVLRCAQDDTCLDPHTGGGHVERNQHIVIGERRKNITQRGSVRRRVKRLHRSGDNGGEADDPLGRPWACNKRPEAAEAVLLPLPPRVAAKPAEQVEPRGGADGVEKAQLGRPRTEGLGLVGRHEGS
mmetsp:Transcript_35951/g.94564  ORF Transcript_35951/g.94564 Transcript_35951/m.94564 type:complete len:222 (+) Transcript_35951:572-1237(+)